MTAVNISSGNVEYTPNNNTGLKTKKFKFMKILRKMYRNETIRPRRSNNSWMNAMDQQVIKNRTPIFKIGEYEPNEYSSINISHGKTSKTPKKLEKDQKKGAARKCLNQIETYCDNTTLHGLRYVGDTTLTIGERIFWLIAFTIAIGFAGYYISNIYRKWNTSPVIISFSPFDADLTNIPFPAVTICNMNQAKKYEAEKVLREGPEIEQRILYGLCNSDNQTIDSGSKEDTRWETLRDFLVKVGSSCESMLRLCKWRNEIVNCEAAFNNDLTDEGLCCSFNRLPDNKIYRNTREIGILNRTYPDKVYDWSPEKGFTEEESGDDDYIPRRPLGAGAHLGLTVVIDANIDEYFCSSTSSIGFKVILSNPLETPKMADFGFLVSPGTETRFAVVPSIREATESLRDIEIPKRQCYFASERRLRYYRSYTSRNCGLECLSNYTYKNCNCVPYFLPKSSFMKICDTSDAICVNIAKGNMELTFGDASSCNCLPGCFELVYSKSHSRTKIPKHINVLPDNISCTKKYFAKNMAVLHFYFDYTKYTKIIKREIYDFTDFLANTGGLLGIFLGFSFLSIVEMFYHFTIRILCIYVKYNRKNKKAKFEFLN